MEILDSILGYTVNFSLVVSLFSLVLMCIKILIGVTFAERVLALDSMFSAGIGLISIIAIKSGNLVYVDIAIALGLVGFLSTVAFARLIIKRGSTKIDG